MRARRTALPMLLALLLVFAFGLFPAFAYAEDPVEVSEATEEAPVAEPEPELDLMAEPEEAPVAEPEDAPEEEALLEDAPEVELAETPDESPQLSEEPPVLSASALTVANIPLYDIDGTTSTLNDLYGGTYRVVIVGRPACGNTQYTVRRALALSQVADYEAVNFLVLDVDGDFEVFKEGFGSTETDRVRFYSSDDHSYNTWVRTYLDVSGNITLPMTLLINDRDEVVYATTGPQQLYDIISEHFNIGSEYADLTLYDIDGTTTTMVDRYGGTNRIVVVGRPSCMNTQRVVGGVLAVSTMEEYQYINFLVLDVDGDRATFQEGFGPRETDRVRFYSSNDYTYSRWAMDAYRTFGVGTSGDITLPIIVVMDENDDIVCVETGVTSVVDLCRDCFHISNPNVTSVQVRGYTDTEQCRELLDLVNAARADAGVGPLVWDADLAACAMQRASETAVYFDHTRPDGTICFTAWPSWSLSGAENIAAGQEDVYVVNTSWTNSSGHYANMVNGDMASFGAALYVNDAGEHYWVECFSGEIGPAGEGTSYAGDWTTSVSVDTSVVKVSNWPTTVNLETGRTYQVGKPALGDANLVDPTVTWASSDPSVATVDQNGLVTAVHPGEAMITAVLANNPKLTATLGVAVGARSIKYASVYFEGYASTFTYTGSPITPALTVKSLGYVLNEGVDYTLEYQNNTEVGTASVVITGIGMYSGSKTVNFTIVEPPVLIDISGATISAIDDQEYEGYELQPTFTVTLDGVKLVKGTDYTVRYVDNVEIGTAHVYVDGIGSYTGTASTTFEIVEEQEDDAIFIGLADIDYDYYQTYTGSPVKPKIVATYEGEQLVEGKDYILSYKDNTECGLGKIIVTGIGRFFHEYRYLFQIVMPPTKTDISPAVIDRIADCVYQGAPVEPSLRVTLGGSLLREGSDYEVLYANNNAVGTATVTVTGIGAYEGSISATFEIVAHASFRDVTAATPHADDIVWLAESGVSTGWSEKDGTRTFRPTNTVIRQDMAAFLFRLAKSWGLVDDSWQPSGTVTFTDVSERTPHYREIMWLAESGVSAGWKVGSGREFRPTNTVVRQDMAAFLRRMQQLRDPSLASWKPTGASPFRDVTARTPHSDDILWLAESGVSAGWTVGGSREFRPTNTVIRQDMAAFLHRLDGLG